MLGQSNKHGSLLRSRSSSSQAKPSSAFVAELSRFPRTNDHPARSLGMPQSPASTLPLRVFYSAPKVKGHQLSHRWSLTCLSRGTRSTKGFLCVAPLSSPAPPHPTSPSPTFQRWRRPTGPSPSSLAYAACLSLYSTRAHASLSPFLPHSRQLIVAFGGFLFGYDTSNIGGVVAMPAFLKRFGYQAANGEGAGSCALYDGVYFCISSTSKSLITSFLSIVSKGKSR